MSENSKEDEQYNCRCNLYDDLLNQKSKKQLLDEYILTWHKITLINAIKDIYGNDGKDDCSFEPE